MKSLLVHIASGLIRLLYNLFSLFGKTGKTALGVPNTPRGSKAFDASTAPHAPKASDVPNTSHTPTVSQTTLEVLYKQRLRIVCLSRQQNQPTQDFKLLKAYFTQHYPQWDVVVLAKTFDSPWSYIPHMLTQIRAIASSDIVVLDSYCIVVSLLGKHIKAPVLQMWHALGNMKKFGYLALDTPEGHSSKTAHLLHMHEGYDSVLVSSKTFAADLAAGFKVPVEILYEAPLPRVDLLLDPAVKRAERVKAYAALPELDEQKQNIVYCPTFRRTPAPNEQQAMAALLDAIDFSRYNFIFKKHPVSTQVINDPRVIQALPPEIEPLYLADYVISDYSTVIYEAGLLSVPVYLYAYDWNTYAEKRSLNINLEHDVPALFTDDPQEIVHAIEHDEFDAETYRVFIRANVAVPSNTTCTQRIADHMLDMIAQGKRA